MHLIVTVAIENVQRRCQNLPWAVHVTYFELCTVHRGVQNGYSGTDVNVPEQAPAEFNRDGVTHKRASARRGK